MVFGIGLHIGKQPITDIKSSVNPGRWNNTLTIVFTAVAHHHAKAQCITGSAIHTTSHRRHIGTVHQYIGIMFSTNFGPDIVLNIILKWLAAQSRN